MKTRWEMFHTHQTVSGIDEDTEKEWRVTYS